MLTRDGWVVEPWTDADDDALVQAIAEPEFQARVAAFAGGSR